MQMYEEVAQQSCILCTFSSLIVKEGKKKSREKRGQDKRKKPKESLNIFCVFFFNFIPTMFCQAAITGLHSLKL